METPCILIFSIDYKNGYFFGCGRTRTEIGGWMTYSDEERRLIMSALPARLDTVERRPRRETRRSRMARDRTSL